MNDFSDFFAPVIMVFLIIAAIVAAIFGISVANEAWNCHTYEGTQTKMMGGTCMARDERGRWVTLDSYVKEPSINVHHN